MSVRSGCWLACMCAIICPLESLVAEGNPRHAVESILQQVVELRLLDAQERSQALEQQRDLQDLEALYAGEAERNRNAISHLREQLDQLDHNAASDTEQRDRLRSRLDELETLMEHWEVQVRQWLALLPEVEQRKLYSDLFESSMDSAGLGDLGIAERMQQLGQQLRSLHQFHSAMHLHQQWIELPDQGRIEAEVLYAGLSLAWFVTRDRSLAGYGKPENGKWCWQLHSEAADAIVMLQEGIRKPGQASWVSVPVPAWKGEAP